jgi:hypothetical protein
MNTCDHMKTKDGKICGKRISGGAIGLANHKKKHAPKTPRVAPAPAKKPKAASAPAKKNSLKVERGVLKLTARKVPYDHMTAAVGERGGKKIEVREDGKWIRQRLDGRTYNSVKIYQSGSLWEKAPWTLFESEGYEQRGAEGETYKISFGKGVGIGATIEGKVWVIRLGKVIQRHTPQQMVELEPSHLEFDDSDESGEQPEDTRMTMEQVRAFAKEAVHEAFAKEIAKEAVERASKAREKTSPELPKSPPRPVVKEVAIDMFESMGKVLVDALKASRPEVTSTTHGDNLLSPSQLQSWNNAQQLFQK